MPSLYLSASLHISIRYSSVGTILGRLGEVDKLLQRLCVWIGRLFFENCDKTALLAWLVDMKCVIFTFWSWTVGHFGMERGLARYLQSE